MGRPRSRLQSVALTVLAIVGVCAIPLSSLSIDVASVTNDNSEELWVEPTDLATRDLFNGPWGAAHAPDPHAQYTFIAPKKGGINPGMTVRDPRGREWKVKQPPNTGRNAEGPVEVVLSRVLSAVGYHQPPVYFLPAFQLYDGKGTHQTVGGRFRLSLPVLTDVGEWKWMDNPFVEKTPYYGLLVILLMFNSSDLKDSNNTLYEYPTARREHAAAVVRRARHRYRARQHGALTPVRGDPDVFERLGFIKRVENGFVEIHYDGRHQPLVDGRIRPLHVRWAAQLLSGLSAAQWHDAFRAGGYAQDVRQRFIDKLQAKIAEGLSVQ